MSDRRRPSQPGLSIICVYNNLAVRRECLDRSIEAYAGDIDLDYIPVDNTAQAFLTAGAALNYGASKARHDLVVFVHQDVYLHSIERLVDTGRFLGCGGWAMLGANGIAGDGGSVGRLRDRVRIIGRSADQPVAVDSLDEVLFMMRRELVLAEPLAEDPELAWHAYAVEYSARQRLQGRLVGAVNLGITHNSLTINLNRLDVAHQTVGSRYPQLQPIQTTCGAIGGVSPRQLRLGPLERYRWRARWLRQSLRAIKAQREASVAAVLSDIRFDVDLLGFSEGSPLHVLNVDRGRGFVEFGSAEVCLSRRGRPVMMRTLCTLEGVLGTLADFPINTRVLIADISQADLTQLVSGLDGREWLIGVQSDALWVLLGPDARSTPSEWSRPQAVPLGPQRSALALD